MCSLFHETLGSCLFVNKTRINKCMYSEFTIPEEIQTNKRFRRKIIGGNEVDSTIFVMCKGYMHLGTHYLPFLRDQ